ncbi:MAG: hypothetical protein C5B50_29530 [Verrucomicrobia bacterium]|nr:MAG: hypothetical protein C5B50_29530 [Verrucomicrobiota bacterium]
MARHESSPSIVPDWPGRAGQSSNSHDHAIEAILMGAELGQPISMTDDRRPLRILVVEDDENDVGLLEATLEDSGFAPTCHQVANAADMIAALDTQEWDLIIADYDLKNAGFNGLAALELVRERHLDLPFIIVSGVITDAKAVAAMKAGAHDYVVKDFRMPRLGPAVQRELREAGIRQERRRAEKLISAEHAITRLLADAESMEQAIPKILQILLESLRMELAEWWRLSDDGLLLEPGIFEARVQSADLEPFIQEGRQVTFRLGAGIPGAAWQARRPVWGTDLEISHHGRKAAASTAGLRTAVAIPIQGEHSFFGVFSFLSTRRMQPDDSLLNMLAAIAGEVAQFAQRRQAEEALRRAHDELEIRVQQRTAQLRTAIAERERLEHELLEITENERRRIGLDLHDDLGQKLSGIALMTKALETRLARQKAGEATDAAKIHDEVQEAIGHASGVARDLTSLDVKEDDLAATLRSLTARAKQLFSISCAFKSEGTVPPLPAPVIGQLHKIAQEAITNAVKHGKAKRVIVTLARTDSKLALSVRNDGLPFPDLQTHSKGGMGLRIMNYRAKLIGGSLEVKAFGKSGTLLTCTLPVQ